MPEAEWWSALDGQMAQQERRATRRSIAVNYPPELYGYVSAAARARQMSMTAFQRRAALAIAQADLGFDWLRVMEHEPAISGFETGTLARRVAGLHFGAWHVLDLGEYGDARDE